GGRGRGGARERRSGGGGGGRSGAAPRPAGAPPPPMFQPFSVSETTIRYTAKSSIVPWILVAHPPDFQRLCHVYQDVAAENGRKLGLGESVGAFRAVHFGRNEAEAVPLLRGTN